MDIGQRLKGKVGLLSGMQIKMSFYKAGELPLHLCDRHPLVEQHEAPREGAYPVPIIEHEGFPDKRSLCGTVGNEVVERKVCILVPVRYYAGDIGPQGIHTYVDHFPPDGRFRRDVAEILPDLLRGEHHAIGIVEAGSGISGEPLILKDLEILRIGDNDGRLALWRLECFSLLAGAFARDYHRPIEV